MISEQAFYGCVAIEAMSIPAGVSSIGESAFYGCKMLSLIDFEGNAPLFNNNCFKNIVANVSYNIVNQGWSEEVCQDYGGTITWQSYCGHVIAIDDAVLPTCTATGLTEGKHCSVCSEVLTAQDVVPVLGHEEVIDAAVPPTCITIGLTEGKHCARCSEVFIAQNEIPMVEVNVSITLPAALAIIDEQAFAESTFECVIIPDGCTAIYAGAFEENVSLRFVAIPASVEQIDATAFKDCCEDLMFIVAPESVAEAFAIKNSIQYVYQ